MQRVLYNSSNDYFYDAVSGAVVDTGHVKRSIQLSYPALLIDDVFIARLKILMQQRKNSALLL